MMRSIFIASLVDDAKYSREQIKFRLAQADIHTDSSLGNMRS